MPKNPTTVTKDQTAKAKTTAKKISKWILEEPFFNAPGA